MTYWRAVAVIGVLLTLGLLSSYAVVVISANRAATSDASDLPRHWIYQGNEAFKVYAVVISQSSSRESIELTPIPSARLFEHMGMFGLDVDSDIPAQLKESRPQPISWWSTFEQLLPLETTDVVKVSRFGWPFWCAWCGEVRRNSPGVAASSYRVMNLGRAQLPTGLLWPGIAANTIVLAGAWWVVLFAPSSLRRFLRQRRGHCVICGHDRDGLADGTPCQKCGIKARRPRQRVIRLAAVLVCLAAMTTVAVAWGSAALWQFKQPSVKEVYKIYRDPVDEAKSGPHRGDYYEVVSQPWHFGVTSLSIRRMPLHDTDHYEFIDGPPSVARPSRAAKAGISEFDIPLVRRSPFPTARAQALGSNRRGCGSLMAGFPFKAFMSLDVSWLQRSGWISIAGTDVPSIPLWRGLIANIAVYVVIWYLLLLAPGQLRRTIRRRRGRCVTCGYSLRGLADGSVCPECGRAQN